MRAYMQVRQTSLIRALGNADGGWAYMYACTPLAVGCDEQADT